jgi:hypothetical protein
VEGPCQAYEVAPRGGNAAHNAYAKAVIGRDKDYCIIAPPGRREDSCQTDGLDSKDPRLVWEVPTRSSL